MPRGFAGGGREKDRVAPGDCSLCVSGFRGSSHRPRRVHRGVRGFLQSARIVSYHEHDHQVDLIADMAVASFGFEMIYEREGSGFRARGRDLWVFARQAGGWLACWRTMLDLHEEPASA